MTPRSAVASVAAVIALSCGSSSAYAQASAAQMPETIDAVCSGCRVAWPTAAEPAPLLVVLHGDGQSAAAVYARWRPWAEARGVAIFAPACPASAGCKGSWWRWDGDPAWLRGAIDRLAEAHPIDRDRIWALGWSGGASYLGWRTQAFERTFAAIVFHGGGVPPADDACPATPASVLFLSGDRNPLHYLAVDLRRHYEACGQAVDWRLLHGADHEAEWAALDAHTGGAIFDWLATKRRALSAPAPAEAAPAAEAPVVPGPATPAAAVPPRRGCSIEGGTARDVRPWGALVVGAMAAARRRRSRRQR